MTAPHRWVARLLRRRALAEASREELHFHVDAYVDELVRAGIDEPEARRRARLELGDVELEVERLSDRRPGAAAEDWIRDVRHAVRGLGRTRSFVAVTALLIAIGVGASTTVYTLVDRVLLRPLALPQPAGLVRIYETSPSVPRTGVSRGNLAEWRRRSQSFDALATTYVMGRTISSTSGEDAEVVDVAQVTCDFLPLLRVTPLLGVGFTEDQCRAATYSSAAAPTGTDLVVILSEALWRRRFAADPAIVGSVVSLDRQLFRVIGVVPGAVGAALPGAEAFIAWQLEGALPFDQRYTTAFGRLRAGRTLADARIELASVAADLGRERSQAEREWTIAIVPLQEDLLQGLGPVLLTLLAAAGVLLLIATTNVATLFSARALTRGHEVSLHLALGAPRSRIVRRGLLEAALVSLAGGAIGTLGAIGAIRLLRGLWADLPRANELTIDGTVLLFALIVTVLSAALAGLAPAIRQAGGSPMPTIGHGSRLAGGRASRRLSNGMVAMQVALTFVLLTGAGLLVRTVGGLRASDSGFDPREVVVAAVFLDSQGYRNGEASRAYYAELFAGLRALPGVSAVGGATTLPTSGLGPDFARPAWPLERAGDPDAVRLAAVRIVTPGYLDALRIKLVEGRPFDDTDGPETRRVIAVSERLARNVWPGERHRQTACGGLFVRRHVSV